MNFPEQVILFPDNCTVARSATATSQTILSKLGHPELVEGSTPGFFHRYLMTSSVLGGLILRQAQDDGIF